MLCEPNAIGTRTLLWFGHGRMQLEHGRYYGLGMDDIGMVTQACSRSRQPEKARTLKCIIPIYIYTYMCEYMYHMYTYVCKNTVSRCMYVYIYIYTHIRYAE